MARAGERVVRVAHGPRVRVGGAGIAEHPHARGLAGARDGRRQEEMRRVAAGEHGRAAAHRVVVRRVRQQTGEGDLVLRRGGGFLGRPRVGARGSGPYCTRPTTGALVRHRTTVLDGVPSCRYGPRVSVTRAEAVSSRLKLMSVLVRVRPGGSRRPARSCPRRAAPGSTRRHVGPSRPRRRRLTTPSVDAVIGARRHVGAEHLRAVQIHDRAVVAQHAQREPAVGGRDRPR